MKESDHRTIIATIDTNWMNSKPISKERVEIYNYSDKEDFDSLINMTTNNKQLETIFDNPDDDLEVASKKWLNALKNIIKNSFTKIRIREAKLHPKLESLLQQKESIKLKLTSRDVLSDIDAEIEHKKLETVEAEIVKLCAEKNKKLVDSYIGVSSDTF